MRATVLHVGRSPSSSRRRPLLTRAFTIVEVIVVVVILGIISAAIAPRLADLGGRRLRAVAESAADLLSVAARRDALTSQRIAIDFDSQTSRLRLLVLAPVDGTLDWRDDPLVATVDTRDLRFANATSDGVELEPSQFRVEFPQNDRRPVIAFTLTDGGTRLWRVDLPAGASQATARPIRQGDPPPADGPIDLDAAGLEDTPW